MMSVILYAFRTVVLILWIMNPVLAQDVLQKTLPYENGQEAPEAGIDDVKWIAGHWKGEAFGGLAEEVWTPPLGKSMMGSFKLVVDKEVGFYELMTISKENNTLILRLRHFDKGLKAWEEKDLPLEYRLVKATANKVFFEGFTFERINENHLIVYVVIQHNGETAETRFDYQRDVR